MNDRELRAKVIQAMELRGTGYFPDAVMDIVESFERKPLTELEREQAREARRTKLIELLRATDPARSMPRVGPAASATTLACGPRELRPEQLAKAGQHIYEGGDEELAA
jgi:hypothetical protein